MNISSNYRVMPDAECVICVGNGYKTLYKRIFIRRKNVPSAEEARQVLADDPESGFDELDPEAVPDAGGMEDAEGAEPPAQEGNARPFEVTSDSPEWKTADNGKKIQIETETGEILKGEIGQHGFRPNPNPITDTKPDKARYEALLKEHEGDHMKAAHEYFREKFQGRYVKAKTDKGEIEAYFTGGGWREIKRNMAGDKLKAELVQHMPDIIATGQYHRNDIYKERIDNAVAFYEYRKTVETSNGPCEAIVDVMEMAKSEPKHRVYNMTHEGTNGYVARISHDEKENGTISMPLGSFGEGKIPRLIRVAGPITRDNAVFYENNLRPLFEVVNIRFAGE